MQTTTNTLGSMTMAKGIAAGLTHGNVIAGFPAGIVFPGNGSVLGIPAVLIVCVVVAVPVVVMMSRSPLGIIIAMCGSNQEAVRFSGVDPAGGFGRVGGLLMSLVILQLISTAASLLGMSQFLTLALWGAILLAVTGMGRLRQWVRLSFQDARLPLHPAATTRHAVANDRIRSGEQKWSA